MSIRLAGRPVLDVHYYDQLLSQDEHDQGVTAAELQAVQEYLLERIWPHIKNPALHVALDTWMENERKDEGPVLQLSGTEDHAVELCVNKTLSWGDLDAACYWVGELVGEDLRGTIAQIILPQLTSEDALVLAHCTDASYSMMRTEVWWRLLRGLYNQKKTSRKPLRDFFLTNTLQQLTISEDTLVRAALNNDLTLVQEEIFLGLVGDGTSLEVAQESARRLG